MEIDLSYREDIHRRLCIKKDLIELTQWIDTLTVLNDKLSQLKLIEKQLLKDRDIESALMGIRRKNTLVMGTLCKYEQELDNEYEFGKRIYDVTRAKEHEKKRVIYTELMQNFYQLRKAIYRLLTAYKRN
ncbi:hypothetical protein pgond44_11136 [Psychroflexus gondwanensis ACAM 44]|uniref:Uncharacterized protein n=1 Tax=Psychroflexus gondwanensis ACAM 44 TaxID=1189619 RepID=N1WTT6_9FLAO|nr:hypothetical protein [Psychroflexus gondwanensis]EMY80534.1 hypothetical protein pgond44_11136 [Psychroflexus gondwanensis ACAM 44]